MSKSGIYWIYNKQTHMCYIGSAINIQHRWSTHKWHLLRNSHHNKYLQSAWNKYGLDSFIFSILEYCEKPKLIEREQHYLDKFKSYDRTIGYNLRQIVDTNSGYKHSEESKKIRSVRMKRFKHSEQSKLKMSIIQSNRSKEIGEKISKSKLGFVVSEETKIKIGNANRGRTRNRNYSIWPCKEGSLCKCRNCKNKKNLNLKNWRHSNKEYINV